MSNKLTRSKKPKAYDLIVLGGGTVGLVAAHGAAGMGARVAMIEPNHPGGDCLWTGCVPSKRLLSAAHAAHVMRTADRHGLTAVEPEVNFSQVMQEVKDAQSHIAHHDSVERLVNAGVDVIADYGKFDKPGFISAGGETFRYRKALIGTGATPILPPIPGLLEANPLTSETVWELEELPESLAVIGGGVIGVELGQAFSRLGSKVTIIEGADRLLPALAPNVSSLIASRFEAEGINIVTGDFVTSVEPADKTGSANFALLVGSKRVECSHVLVAIGRAPTTNNIGLESVGVELTEKGFVKVDDHLQTSNTHIYAGGDVVGIKPFTHTAGYHGSTVVSNALFKLRRKVDHENIPYAIFCDPEIASVGKVDGANLTRHHFDYEQLDRSVTSGTPYGFADLFTEGNKVVGATVVGETAGETINEMTVRVTSGAKLSAIGSMTRPYPTFAEGTARAARETLREKYFTPRTRRLTKPILSVFRTLHRN